MKLMPLSEAKANLSRYERLCQDEPVIVTVDGLPSFQLTSLKDDDDLVDRLLAENPEFGQLLEKRTVEPSVSTSDARKRL